MNEIYPSNGLLVSMLAMFNKARPKTTLVALSATSKHNTSASRVHQREHVQREEGEEQK